MNNKNTVTLFIDQWNKRDFDSVLEMLSDDIEYHNIPMPVLHGKSAVKAFIESLGETKQINWIIHHIVAEGNVVMTERTDKFEFTNTNLSLPVMGIFEISDGKILKWRDYFDLQDFQQQMAKA